MKRTHGTSKPADGKTMMGLSIIKSDVNYIKITKEITKELNILYLFS